MRATKFDTILNFCDLTEDQFLAGIPALFDIDTTDEFEPRLGISALYKDGKIFIQSHTFQSLRHYHNLEEGRESNYGKTLVEPIVVKDFDKLKEILKYISDNVITTTLAFLDDVNLQVVLAIMFDRYAAKKSLGHDFENEKDRELSLKILHEGVVERLLRCKAIDEWWKEEHLKVLIPR